MIFKVSVVSITYMLIFYFGFINPYVSAETTWEKEREKQFYKKRCDLANYDIKNVRSIMRAGYKASQYNRLVEAEQDAVARRFKYCYRRR